MTVNVQYFIKSNKENSNYTVIHDRQHSMFNKRPTTHKVTIQLHNR